MWLAPQEHRKMLRSRTSGVRVKSLQNITQSKAGKIVYDDVAVGGDGFAAVCRGEADDTGAGSAAGGQAVE